MNDDKLMTVSISHFPIGGLFLILEVIFLIGGVPFYETWTILAYGILLLIFGALSYTLQSRIAVMIEVVCFMALFALSPITSAVSVFGAVAILLAAVTAVFTFMHHGKKAEAVVFAGSAGSAEAAPVNETPAAEAVTAEGEYADYDPNDFEIELYNNGKTGNSEEIKIVVSPYGVTLSEYSDSSFGDNEAHSYVLDEVNTAKFLEALNATEKTRVATVVNKFSGADGISKFKEFCRKSNIEYNSYVG